MSCLTQCKSPQWYIFCSKVQKNKQKKLPGNIRVKKKRAVTPKKRQTRRNKTDIVVAKSSLKDRL